MPTLSAAAGDSGQHRIREDHIQHMEVVLKQAGVKSPRWHSSQTRIQRDIHDIAYLVEQALKSADPAASEQYAREAHLLLQRAVARGHFHAEDVTPIMDEIDRLLRAKM